MSCPGHCSFLSGQADVCLPLSECGLTRTQHVRVLISYHLYVQVQRLHGEVAAARRTVAAEAAEQIEDLQVRLNLPALEDVFVFAPLAITALKGPCREVHECNALDEGHAKSAHERYCQCSIWIRI